MTRTSFLANLCTCALFYHYASASDFTFQVFSSDIFMNHAPGSPMTNQEKSVHLERGLGYSSSSSNSSSSSSQSSQHSGSAAPEVESIGPISGSHSSSSTTSSSSSYSSNSIAMEDSSNSQNSGSSSSPSTTSDNALVYGDSFDASDVFAANPESPEGASQASNLPLFVDYSTQEHQDYHDNQDPKVTHVYSCGRQGDPRLDSLPVDVTYQYNMVISSQTNNNQALLNVESNVMQDLSNSLGCSKMKRNLRTAMESDIIGLQWFEGSHENVSCSGPANDLTLTCAPVTAQFTAFLEQDATTEVINELKQLLLLKIQSSMSDGRYTTDVIKQVIFANDESQIPADLTKVDDKSQVLSQSSISVKNASTRNQYIPMIAAIIGFVVVVTCLILVKRGSKKNRNTVPVSTNKKTIVRFAPNLEEDIPTRKCSNHSNGSSYCSNDDTSQISGADSDIILQWDDHKQEHHRLQLNDPDKKR